MPRPIAHTEHDKGDRVIIDGGLYEGLTGWVHTNCNSLEDRAWVIVAPGTSRKDKVNPRETARCLKLDSFRLADANLDVETPATFEQSLLQEHKDIATDMMCLARKLAQFEDLHPDDGAELVVVFWQLWMSEKAKRSGAARLQGARYVRKWESNPNNPKHVESCMAEDRASKHSSGGSQADPRVPALSFCRERSLSGLHICL